MNFKLSGKKTRATEEPSTLHEEASSDKIYNLAASDFANYAYFFENYQLEELMIEEKGTRVLFRRSPSPASSPQASVPVVVAPVAPTIVPEPVETPPSVSEASEPEEPSNITKVLSPLNGTFYASASPESPPFVSVGTQVSPGSVLCIVEAMKIFNELKAETAGKIVKVLAKNAEAVKEGQELFWIE